jgi:hypothetical protein
VEELLQAKDKERDLSFGTQPPELPDATWKFEGQEQPGEDLSLHKPNLPHANGI